MQHIPSPEPAVTSSRRGLRLRHLKDGCRSFYEVAEPGELERIKPSLTQAEYDARLALRRLWSAGAMNPEPSSSCLERLDMPPGGFHDADQDYRLEAQDVLRAAIRSMGYWGMGGRYAVEVACYERRVKTEDELLHLRQALSRLAEHLRQVRRLAA